MVGASGTPDSKLRTAGWLLANLLAPEGELGRVTSSSDVILLHLATFATAQVCMHVCMHQHQCDCRIRGKWKNPVCSCHRSSRKKTAASRMWKMHEISLWKKSMEFPIQSHLWLTSAWRAYIILSMAYITVEWRGQQHAREAVESTASGATAATQATSAQTG